MIQFLQFPTLKVIFLIFITKLPLLLKILNIFDIFVYTFLSDFEENTQKKFNEFSSCPEVENQ